ncbi:hypothetical protein HPP92_009479 [Vanilla planifolia]|uniref:Uncharacterized protein n=1 Tax=Vanilla planifolia TaxID=51239 RepID=A0A835RAC8_VANPL|nr:hypothetical protein HPP92_009479 [Vanilla planifolia]
MAAEAAIAIILTFPWPRLVRTRVVALVSPPPACRRRTALLRLSAHGFVLEEGASSDASARSALWQRGIASRNL